MGRSVESSWNVMAHGDARVGKWRGNWRMEWVDSTIHTTSEHGVSSITTADAHTSAASSRLNWRPCRFKWTRPFRQKTKSGFCACAIIFQMQSTSTSPCTIVTCAVVAWCVLYLSLQGSHGICGGQSGAGTGSGCLLWFSPVLVISTTTAHSYFLHTLLPVYDIGNWERSWIKCLTSQILLRSGMSHSVVSFRLQALFI
jgi:hypothetical protein